MKYVLIENIDDYGDPIKRVICKGLKKLGFYTVSLGRKVDYCDYWEKLEIEHESFVDDILDSELLFDIKGSIRRYPNIDPEDLRSKYLIAYSGTKKLIEQYNFSFAVTWGGLLQSSRAIKRACDYASLDVYATEFSFDKSRIYFEKRGIIGNQHEYSEQIALQPLTEAKQIVIDEWVSSCEHTKASFPNSKEEDFHRAIAYREETKKNILLIGQCNIDTVITYDCPDYINTMNAYDDILKELSTFNNLNVVVKLHPGDLQIYKDEIIDLVENKYKFKVIDGDINTYSLMEVFDRGITINSQAGLEMLAHSKNVLTIGKAFYTEQNIGVKRCDFPTLNAAIKFLLETDIDIEHKSRIHSYLYSYLYDYLIDKELHTSSGIAKKLNFFHGKKSDVKLVIIHPSGCDHGSAFYLQELSEKLKQLGTDVLILAEGICPINWNGVPWYRIRFDGNTLDRAIRHEVIAFQPDYIMQVGVRTKTMRAALELKVATGSKLIVQAEDDEDAVFEKYYPGADLSILRSLDIPNVNNKAINEFLSIANLEHTIKVFADPYYDRWVEPVLRILCYKLSILHCSIWDDMADRLYERYQKPSFLIPPILDVSFYEKVTNEPYQRKDILDKFKVRKDSYIIFINGSIYPYTDEFEKFVDSVKMFKNLIGKPVCLVISGRCPGSLQAYARDTLNGSVYFRSLSSPSEEDYNQMILASDIICAPGYNNDFNKYRMSSRLAKAIALEKPIFTYKIGFAAKLKNMKHGYFCNYDSSHEWVFVLMCAYTNKGDFSVTRNAKRDILGKLSSVNISNSFNILLRAIQNLSEEKSQGILINSYAKKLTSYTSGLPYGDDALIYTHHVYKRIADSGLEKVTEAEFLELLSFLIENKEGEALTIFSKVGVFIFKENPNFILKLSSALFKAKLWGDSQPLLEKLLTLETDENILLSINRRLSICYKHLDLINFSLEHAMNCIHSSNDADINNIVSILYHIDEKGIELDLVSDKKDEIKSFIKEQIDLAISSNRNFNKFLRALGESYCVSPIILSKYYENCAKNINTRMQALELRDIDYLKGHVDTLYSSILQNFKLNLEPQKLANINEVELTNPKLLLGENILNYSDFKGKVAVCFLPHVFYNVENSRQQETGQDKFFIETRSVFLQLFKYLLALGNVAILFKNQFHNGKVDTRALPSKINYVFSHHTRSHEKEPGFVHFHVKQSPVSGYVMVDTKGYSGWAASADINDNQMSSVSDLTVESFFKEKCEPLIENKATKYTQSDADFIVEGEYVFCAMQILTDSVAQLAHINSLDMVQNTVEALEGTKYKVVIKRHPLCKSNEVTTVLEKLSKSNSVIISEADIYKIIPNCKAVITVNSGVGLEALIMGKKVFTTGRAEYSPVSIKLYKKDDFLTLYSNLESNADTKLTYKFLNLYFENHLLDAYSKDSRYLEQTLKFQHL
jgi:capsule polysaccharide modification protein KpsS